MHKPQQTHPDQQAHEREQSTRQRRESLCDRRNPGDEKMTHKFLDGLKDFYVFTIRNPCKKKDFPDRVNKDYFCDGEKINNNQVYNLNDRVVIGLLHEGRSCKKEEIDFVKSHEVTGRFCELRNNTPLENLKTGMGDIFIKLAR